MSNSQCERPTMALIIIVHALAAAAAPCAVAYPELLVCSSGNNTVQKFDLKSDQHLGTAASGGGISLPWGVAKGPDGNLYVSGFGSHAVFRYDGSTGAFIDQFIPPQSGGLLGPGDLVFRDDGYLYVVSEYSFEILRYDAQTGAFIDVFIADGSGGLNSPRGIEFGPDGDLFVVDHYGGEVLRFDGVTGAFEEIFVSFGFGVFNGDLAFGPDGNLYVTTYQEDGVARFDGSTGEYLGYLILPFGFVLNGPLGLAFGPDGSLYVASYLGGVTKHDGKTGELLDSLFAGVESPTMIMIDNPVQVTGDINGDGNVNVQDMLAVINSWGPCANPNNCPADIAPAPNGDDTVNALDLLLVINNWG